MKVFSLGWGSTPLILTFLICVQEDELIMGQFVDHVYLLCSRFVPGFIDESLKPRYP